MGLHLELPLALLAALSISSIVSTITTAIQVAVGIGMVIFVHELGHFLVAKWCGVRCDKFYLGFDISGIKLFHFQWGETEYGIGILPLGGYVKMLGQEEDPRAVREEMQKLQAEQQENRDEFAEPFGDADPRNFQSKNVFQRMAIMSAGVIMNVFFAFAAYIIAYFIGVGQMPAHIGAVVPGSPAWTHGIEVGDQILRIGEVEDPSFRDLVQTIMLNDEDQNAVEIQLYRPRTDEKKTLQIFPKSHHEEDPKIGVGPAISLRLHDDPPVTPFSAAANFAESAPAEGFQAHDELIALARPAADPDAERTWQELKTYGNLHWDLVDRPEQTIALKVRRAAPGDQKDEPPSEVIIEVAPNPMKELGLWMTAGTIQSIRPGSPAEQAGLQPDDLILEVNGQPIGDPLRLPARLHELAGQQVTLKVQRPGESKNKEIQVVPQAGPAWLNPPMRSDDPLEIAALGLTFRVLNTISDVAPADSITDPEARAKLKELREKLVNQTVVKAELQLVSQGGKEATLDFEAERIRWPAFYYNFLQSTKPDDQVRLFLKGHDEPVELTAYLSSDHFNPDRGFNFETLSRERSTDSIVEATGWAVTDTISSIGTTFGILTRMIVGKRSFDNVGGPIRIFSLASGVAQQGWGDFLFFLALLSANLAVINFLPIPVLDGGHMVFLIWELLRGRRPPPQLELFLTALGFLFIVGLMCVVLLRESIELYTSWFS